MLSRVQNRSPPFDRNSFDIILIKDLHRSKISGLGSLPEELYVLVIDSRMRKIDGA